MTSLVRKSTASTSPIPDTDPGYLEIEDIFSKIVAKLAEKYAYTPPDCPEKDLFEEDLSIKKLLTYLVYVKHLSLKKVTKIVNKLEDNFKEYKDGIYYDYVVEEFSEAKKLFIGRPASFWVRGKEGEGLMKGTLFPDLTCEGMKEVKGPSKQKIHEIFQVITTLTNLVQSWNPDATLAPYGSLVNGFCIENISDIDLTLILEKWKDKHPSEYAHFLKKVLVEDTLSCWNLIETENVCLLMCDDYCGFEVEICFNNITGMVNSEYIRTLAEVDYRFHEVGMYLKYFISQERIFTKMNKLNSFSVLCMLIVYLQDVVDPPVLPRIIREKTLQDDKISGLFPKYSCARDNERKVKLYPIDVDFETDTRKILTKFTYQLKKRQEREGGYLYNNSTSLDLFRGFMHYYFNGGGFDFIHDVVNTRIGKIQRLKELKTNLEDSKFGISLANRKTLSECVIGVLDPFNLHYVPSRGFRLSRKNVFAMIDCFLEPFYTRNQ
ncbi:unnamed protein product [Moneuplotes crassus]|uniref:Poly(A) RNA polymerase mitochondrial-like central palm domain-containing protein n=1 Tax=Euplotes crassus TaxID=5936 RepID=A0AAD1UEG0_EUPCR|nr:unnamed protein product [Moneuplotes crassus]